MSNTNNNIKAFKEEITAAINPIVAKYVTKGLTITEVGHTIQGVGITVLETLRKIL